MGSRETALIEPCSERVLLVEGFDGPAVQDAEWSAPDGAAAAVVPERNHSVREHDATVRGNPRKRIRHRGKGLECDRLLGGSMQLAIQRDEIETERGSARNESTKPVRQLVTALRVQGRLGDDDVAVYPFGDEQHFPSSDGAGRGHFASEPERRT